MKSHLISRHQSKADKDIKYFKFLEEKRIKISLSNFTTIHPPPDANDGLRTLYNIALLIVKAGKSHTIGESLLMPVVLEVLKTVVHHESPEQIIKSISLSNNTF